MTENAKETLVVRRVTYVKIKAGRYVYALGKAPKTSDESKTSP